MERTLEARVSDLENIYTDIPEIMSLRFGRTNSQLDEVNGRLGLLDKQMAMLIRDVRDRRGGVTRQLMEQDKRLDAVEQRLGGLDQRLGGIEGQLAEILRRLP
jgi:archaellum component FlaC